jgi:hypothetical protein
MPYHTKPKKGKGKKKKPGKKKRGMKECLLHVKEKKRLKGFIICPMAS